MAELVPGRTFRALRGDYAQSKRSLTMNDFGRGQFDVLVTTDVASRGLDLSKVGLVINYDLPKQPEEYIHRIGRTGRAGNKGTAVSFVGKRDWQTYTLLTQQLSYDIAPQPHPDLPATFSGKKPKVAKPKAKSGSGKAKAANAKAKSNKPAKRVRAMQGEDIGDMPMRRKATPSQELLDSDDSEE